MTINTETIRDAAEVLDTLTSTLAVDHPLRTLAAARAKSCVSGLYSAADHIEAQAAELATQAQHANFLNAEIARLRDALELFLAHSPEPECAIWRHVHAVARAALSGESHD